MNKNRFLSNLKFSIRFFLKNKFYAFLNIFGLSIGLISVLLLILYIDQSTSYDAYHEKSDRIYRFATHMRAPAMEFKTAMSAPQYGDLFRQEFPEVLNYCRFFPPEKLLFDYEGTLDYETRAYVADPSVFEIFSYEFISGDPKNSLKDEKSIVFTESLARKYFGSEDPVGKRIKIGENNYYTVTGLLKDLPFNTHLKFDALMPTPMNLRKPPGQQGLSEALWNPMIYTYLLFPKGYNINDFDAQFKGFYDKYLSEFGSKVNAEFIPVIQKIDKIHTDASLAGDQPTTNALYIYAFILIAFLILLSSGVNYINLMTSKSIERAREIGMRRVLGSTKKQLKSYFIFESVFLALISLVISYVAVAIILEYTAFNELVEMNLSIATLFSKVYLIVLSIVITLLFGFLSGLYPAFFISKMEPGTALKGAFKSSKSGIVIRKALVGFQVFVSITVTLLTLLFGDYIGFLKDKDLGYEQEGLAIVPLLDQKMSSGLPAFKQELLSSPYIDKVSFSINLLGRNIGDNMFNVESEEGMKQMPITLLNANHDFLDLVGLELVAGRDFDKTIQSDMENSYIINETAARAFNWDSPNMEAAIGKKIGFFHQNPPGKVVGVLADFHPKSLHSGIEPLVINLVDPEGFMYVRFAKGGTREGVNFIKEKWNDFTLHPYSGYLLKEDFKKLYGDEEKKAEIVTLFSIVSIFIVIMGVFGLSSYLTRLKNKELGVRRVMGATKTSLVKILIKDMSPMLLVGLILAIAASVYVISYIGQFFAYNYSFNYLIIASTGILLFIFAFAVVGSHIGSSIRKSKLHSILVKE